MACNCKTIDKIGNRFKISDGHHEKKGWWYYIKGIFNEIVVNRLLNALFLALVCIVVMPLLALIIVFTQIILGNARVIFPEGIINKIKGKTKAIQNEQELQNTY